ncbi:ABC transporter ATP-binding protein [Xinfangfangia pollutisoli]|uniref:ABC transporter ATP-binding protein n=1 Tax=Xinfangfangia pollutisoli TaxID=2865960 RepID=UPI001CD2C716|nr:ABC transporter ATP-binding protein [Xinfangfangia pollutisoli]
MTHILTATGVTVRFGGLTVIDDVDLELRPSEILGLIGPNGAGKTTFVNVLSGFQKPQTGTIRIGSDDITATPPDERVRRGLLRTFQAVRLFPALTVAENLLAAAFAMGQGRKEARAEIAVLAGLLDLEGWLATEARALPYGVERRVGIARAMMARPAFVMLDEPAAGMNHHEAMAFLSVVDAIRARGCGILLIEHNMDIVFRLCDRVQVLRSGKVLASGTPDEIRNHAMVREAYLGSAAA